MAASQVWCRNGAVSNSKFLSAEAPEFVPRSWQVTGLEVGSSWTQMPSFDGTAPSTFSNSCGGKQESPMKRTTASRPCLDEGLSDKPAEKSGGWAQHARKFAAAELASSAPLMQATQKSCVEARRPAVAKQRAAAQVSYADIAGGSKSEDALAARAENPGKSGTDGSVASATQQHTSQAAVLAAGAKQRTQQKHASAEIAVATGQDEELTVKATSSPSQTDESSVCTNEVQASVAAVISEEQQYGEASVDKDIAHATQPDGFAAVEVGSEEHVFASEKVHVSPTQVEGVKSTVEHKHDSESIPVLDHVELQNEESVPGVPAKGAAERISKDLGSAKLPPWRRAPKAIIPAIGSDPKLEEKIGMAPKLMEESFGLTEYLPQVHQVESENQEIVCGIISEEKCSSLKLKLKDQKRLTCSPQSQADGTCSTTCTGWVSDDTSSARSSTPTPREPMPEPMPSSGTVSPADDEEAIDTARGSLFGIQALLQWRFAADSSDGTGSKLCAEKHAIENDAIGSSCATTGMFAKARSSRVTSRAVTPLSLDGLLERPAETFQEPPKQNTSRQSRDIARHGRAPQLEVSESSWVSRQRARKRNQQGEDTAEADDEEVVRTLKSLLNKLTLEKFESLSGKLIHCGISNARHVELLIEEIFQKAITQHHFISMYADLCSLLHTYFAEHPIIDDPRANFKKILLNQCQASFEKNLMLEVPPPGLEIVYKMRMLGNIRFVGALGVRKMLAGKVLIAVMQELLHDPTPESLEALAALLVVVGPSFDSPEWPYRVALNAVLLQVAQLSKDTAMSKRVRCLLKDVTDLRNSGWQDRKPKKIEGPKKLEQVAAEFAGEACCDHEARKPNSGWEHQLVAEIAARAPSSKPRNQPRDTFTRLSQNLRDKMKPTPDLQRAEAPEPDVVTQEEAVNDSLAEFDHAACDVEISMALAELRVSYDVPEALTRIANLQVPHGEQPRQFCKILILVTEDNSQAARKVALKLVAQVFLEGHWKAEALSEGLRSFLAETCEDLKLDVPSLPQILREEVHPALAPLVAASLLEAKEHEALRADM